MMGHDYIFGKWKSIELGLNIAGLHLWKMEVRSTWLKYVKITSMEI